MQEFSQRSPGAPNFDAGNIGDFRFMKATNQSRKHMTIVGMVIVSRAKQIRGHRRMVKHAVLATIILTQFQAGNLSNRIRFIRLFQRGCQQTVFRNRLRRESRIDACTAKKQKSLSSCLPRGMDGIRSHRKVLIEELGGISTVGMNPAYLCRRKHNNIRPSGGKPLMDRRLASQIQFRSRSQQQMIEPALLKSAHNSGTHPAAMTGHKDSGS